MTIDGANAGGPYLHGDDISQRAFVCSKDEDAITRAKQLVDGHPVKLWSGQRFILRIERKSE